MLIENFLFDNYDLVYGLKMIAAQREGVEEGDYKLLDSENPRAYKEQMRSLDSLNNLVINTVLVNMQKCHKYLNDNYSTLLDNLEP